MRHVVTSLSTLVFVSVVQLASAAPIVAVNWGGNYVTQTQDFAGDTVAASGDYGDPDGPFAIGGGASIAGRALDLSNAFSPPNSPPGTYAGTSATFYGGESVTNSTLANDGFSELDVLNQGDSDSIHFHLDAGKNDTHTFHILLLWQKSDFLNGLNAVPNLKLGADGQFSVTTANVAPHHTDEELRWIVRDGTQLYISQDSQLITGNGTFTSAYSSLTGWATYNPIDPAGSASAADLLSLDFDPLTATFAAHVFANVTALGFYFEHENLDKDQPVAMHIENFSATLDSGDAQAVPEPASLALWGLASLAGAGAGWYRKRTKATAA